MAPLPLLASSANGVSHRHQHLQTLQGDPLLEEDALRSFMIHSLTMRRLTEGLMESRANKSYPSPPPLTHLAALSPLDMTAQSREQGSRIKGHRQPDVRTRPGPGDARRSGSSSPGEAGLQFLGTSAKGSAAVSRQIGGRRLQRSDIYSPLKPLFTPS
ncbi:hypothetical protein CRENBAI_000049 [Crenichthys baileyi]|uniref:Uncharacterized protein n=1 Tax=Crenichthys baileyi TaxID=28760 RepID=A0AAV9SSI0_9TELE